MTAARKIFVRLAATTVLGCLSAAGLAQSPDRSYRFDISEPNLAQALRSFGQASKLEVVFAESLVKNTRPVSLKGEFTAEAALSRLLDGTGLVAKRGASGAIIITKADVSSGSSPTDQMRVATVDTPGAQPSADTSRQTAEVVVRDRKQVVPFQKSMDLTRTEDDSLPFQVFTAEDIRLSPAMSLEEFLNKELPQNFSTWSADQESGGALTGSTNINVASQPKVNLRGWGADETRYLLNGEPMPPEWGYGGSDASPLPNLARIPLASIERIEVLSSAAGAIYGVGASGGAINIITRQDYGSRPNGRVSVRYSTPADVSAPRRNFDLSYSQPLNWWGLSLNARAGYGDTQPMPVKYRQEESILRWRRLAVERNGQDFSSPNAYMGATPNITAQGSSTSVDILPGNAGGQYQWQATVPAGTTGPIPLSAYQPDFNLALAEGNAGSNLWATESTLGALTDDTTLGLGLRKQIGEAWSASLEFDYSNQTRKSRQSATSPPTTVNIAPPDATNPNRINPFGRSITVRWFDPHIWTAGASVLGDYPYQADNELSGLRFSMRGRMGEWYSAFSMGINEQRSHTDLRAITAFAAPTNTTSYSSIAASLTPAINAGLYNPLVDHRVAMAAAPAFYDNFRYRTTDTRTVNRTYTSTLRVSGPVLEAFGRTFNLTAGADFQRMKYLTYEETATVRHSATGQVIGAPAVVPVPEDIGSYQQHGLYAEMSLPLVTREQGFSVIKSLELDLSGRMNWVEKSGYQSAASSPTGFLDTAYDSRTRDFAYGMRYELGLPKWLEDRVTLPHWLAWVDDLNVTLRGMPFPRSGRKLPTSSDTEPYLGVNAFSLPSGFFPPEFEPPLRDPRRGNEQVPVLLPDQYVIGGNPDLRPESTKTTSFGFIITPRSMDGRLRVSVDYLASDRKDAIEGFGALAGQKLLELEDLIPGAVRRGAPDGHPSGVGPIEFLDLRSHNVGRIQQKSVDLDARFILGNIGPGRLELTAVATRQLSYKLQTSLNGAMEEQVRNPLGRTLSQMIAWRGNAGVRWVGTEWSVGWRTYYQDYVMLPWQAVDTSGLGGSIPPNYAFQGGDRAPRAFDHDLTIGYSPMPLGNARGFAGLMQGTSMVLSITNVFDRTPRFWAPSAGRGIVPFDTLKGREITLNFSKDFGLR